jgi:ABC-type amino acid transport substrate-binding protein
MTGADEEPPVPPEPEPEPARPTGTVAARRRARWRTAVPMTRLVVLLILIVAVVVVAGTVAVVAGPPSEDDLLKQAGMTGKRELLIGVKDDQPGVSLLDPKTGRFTGFDVDIGYLVASDLGFRPDQVRFLPIESEDRERMRAFDPRSGDTVTVDLVVASFSVTAARVAAGVNFSAPYLETEQSVLTRTDHPRVTALSDLTREKVCTISTSTSNDALRRAGITNAKLSNGISSCVEGLMAHTYDAVTTDAAILAGFTHDPRYHGKVKLHDIGLETTEKYAINVGANNALRTLVNLSLYRSWHDPNDRRWEDAFDRNLRVEEADARPQDVAVDTQPEVGKPDVRQWPWQR